MADTSPPRAAKRPLDQCTIIFSELVITTPKPTVAKCLAISSIGAPHEWNPASVSQPKSTTHSWLHHEAHINVYTDTIQSEGIRFKVVPISGKKVIAEFIIPLADIQLRHNPYLKKNTNSFTEAHSGVCISFKAHLNSPQLMIAQLKAVEDDEKMMAIQDLLDLAKNSDSQLHSYLMNDELLLALLDITKHWLHDALFSIELAALLPQLWISIIRSPFYQCIQYFSYDNGTDCDFFEYFVDSMVGINTTPTPSPTPNSAPSSFGQTSSSSSTNLTSSIFFNRERKLQMVGIFGAFIRKPVPHSFRYSLLTQISRLIGLVSKYLTASELKSSSPKGAQEEFLAELLGPQIFPSDRLPRVPHGLLLPMFTHLLNEHERLAPSLVTRILEILKSLPAPTSSSTISNCNLLSSLDVLTEHTDGLISKLATYNWSKYMMMLTSAATSATGQPVTFFSSVELSESATVTSES